MLHILYAMCYFRTVLAYIGKDKHDGIARLH